MRGDPLRAKYIAEKFLENPRMVSDIRNIYCYTGTYQGKEVSVMASGMGAGSMSIYSYELFHFYDVDAIIRIGSTGALLDEVKMRNVVIAMAASTNSNYGAAFGMPGLLAPVADYGMLEQAVSAAKELGVSAKVGPVYTSDHFYYPTDVLNTKARELGHLCIEMETAGLYWTAAACHKKALSILTVSDHLYTGEALSAEDRQESFHEMMEVALETAWRCIK